MRALEIVETVWIKCNFSKKSTPSLNFLIQHRILYTASFFNGIPWPITRHGSLWLMKARHSSPRFAKTRWASTRNPLPWKQSRLAIACYCLWLVVCHFRILSINKRVKKWAKKSSHAVWLVNVCGRLYRFSVIISNGKRTSKDSCLCNIYYE